MRGRRSASRGPRVSAEGRKRHRSDGRRAGRLDPGPRRRRGHAGGHGPRPHGATAGAGARGGPRPLVRGADPRPCRPHRRPAGARRRGACGLDRRPGPRRRRAAARRPRHRPDARPRRVDAASRRDVVGGRDLARHRAVAAGQGTTGPADQRHERDPACRARRERGLAARRRRAARAAGCPAAERGSGRGTVPGHEGRAPRQRQRRARRDARDMATRRGAHQRGGGQPLRTSARRGTQQAGGRAGAGVAHGPAGRHHGGRRRRRMAGVGGPGSTGVAWSLGGRTRAGHSRGRASQPVRRGMRVCDNGRHPAWKRASQAGTSTRPGCGASWRSTTSRTSSPST
jgi:hypothetical protein